MQSPSTDEARTNLNRFTRLDHDHVWHPFTQSEHWEADGDPLVIERGEGCYLVDTEGRRYLDGVSSIWCNVHGHSEPRIIDAIREQTGKICHSTLLGLTHVPVLELTEELLHFLPDSLTRVFFADDGSTAVEAALRMALEWWQKSGGTASGKRTRFASLVDAYHGDTLGAVGVGYVESFHRHCLPGTVPALRVPPPHYFRFYERDDERRAEERSLAALERLLADRGSELAAFIIEPLVQGAAGMLVHSPGYLAAVVDRCRDHDIIVIMDEVATGFGKTGTMFAFEQCGRVPDILVIGKGFTGGMLPLSAAITTERIYRGFHGGGPAPRTFFYGQTFAGNPLAAAAARANLQLFRERSLVEQVRARVPELHREIDRVIGTHPAVDEVRRMGLMIGIELTARPGARQPFSSESRMAQRVALQARKHGAVIRSIGNVVVLMPPLAMNEIELRELVAATGAALESAIKR